MTEPLTNEEAEADANAWRDAAVALIADLRAARAEVAQLREELRTANEASVVLLARAADAERRSVREFRVDL